jgi:hypothetical protein
MSLTRHQVLISNGYLGIEGAVRIRPLTDLLKNRHLLTVISNINYYGYMPSQDVIEVLNGLSVDSLAVWWNNTETALKHITADDRQMDDFVVYQNFPKEVLEMSQCEYWCKQILMYFGFDKEHFRQEPVKRDPLFEEQTLKVLHLADERTPKKIYNSLLENKSRWTTPQLEQVTFLLGDLRIGSVSTAGVSFRENGIQLINILMDQEGANIHVEDATDVLRLAALRSEADVSLREKIKFKNFSRKERRVLCRMLEHSKNLEADLAERPSLFKHLLRRLHPGDFKFTRLSAAYNQLYKGRLRSYASRVEAAISQKDPEVFKLLMQRPGEFVRRFHHLYSIFGGWAVGALSETMDRLTTQQLLKLDGYLRTINNREQLVFPPRGNWTKLQIVENKKAYINQDALEILRDRVHNVVKDRLLSIHPEGFDVEEKMSLVKLQTNDQELASYGRGTVFPLPENVTYLRTASYWENKGSVTWFDNGWNFLDENWKASGTICWNRTNTLGQSAVFSGDPINSKEMKGRGCQMIDLYIDRLVKRGIRYAVWNILCFSHVSFSNASGEVLGTLQWGEKPEKGKLYEPSRAQMVFPLQGDNMTKYIAYIDLVERKLVYMDANLRGAVSSAGNNEGILEKQMPAFVEYLDTLPSVADLLGHAPGEIPVVYSDADRELTEDQPAYVFKPENESNSFKQLELAKFL